MRKPRVHTFYIFFILLFLGFFYITWRWLFTLNLLTSPFTTFWSYALLFAEFMTLIIFTNFSILILKRENLKPHKIQKENENFHPSVDVFICTLNESINILAPTILGAKSINYENKKIYVLDDGRREEVKKLCEVIGVNYITRETNKGFKAGNINNALEHTDGELIAIFDSDHVPFSNFLSKTVPYFQNQNLALVQTPQVFGNLDAMQKNLEIPSMLSNEQDLFYKIIEPALNEYNAVFCGGTNIVLRRKLLNAVGNFPQTTITEDSLLGLILHAAQYDVAYYDKPLAIGLAASNFNEYIKQRKRWAKGNLQILKNHQNWKYYKQLKPLQSFFYITSSFYFLTPIVRIILLLTPVFFLLFDVATILIVFYQIFIFQVVYFALKYTYLFNDEIKPANVLLADVYDVVISIFTLNTILITLFIPEKLQKIKFSVTNKNAKKDNNLNYKITLILILTLLILAEIQGIYDLFYNEIYSFAATIMNLFWNTLNMIILAISLKVVFDKDEKRDYIRIEQEKEIIITDCKNGKYKVELEDISRSGVKFLSDDKNLEDKNCKITAKLDDLTVLIDIINTAYGETRGKFELPVSIDNIDKEQLERMRNFIKFAYKEK